MNAIEVALAAVLFVGSSGVLFHNRFRDSVFLVICAGGIALLSTYFLFQQIAEGVAERSLQAARSGQTQTQTSAPAPATVASRETNAPTTRVSAMQAPNENTGNWETSRGSQVPKADWRPVPEGTNGAFCPQGGQLGYMNGEFACWHNVEGAPQVMTQRENWQPVPMGTNGANCPQGGELGYLNGELVCRQAGPQAMSGESWTPVPEGTNGAFCPQGGQLGYLNGQLLCRN